MCDREFITRTIPKYIRVDLVRELLIGNGSDGNAGKILSKNLLIIGASLRHHVRAFLAKPQAMSKATATKNEICSGARNFKPRTLEKIPTEFSADDDFE